MEAAEPPMGTSSAQNDPDPLVWTYPTRFCRICREDVPATVTMYPPGLPMQFQTPIVEYKNEDEYGRLIKPCKCRGSLRYIHELCLLRSRTENNRAGSMWKCHECGYNFNFQRLAIQRYLSSRLTVVFLTITFMVLVVFMLGFVADPIINVYMDPYDSLTGRESIWEQLEVRSPTDESPVSAWMQHFAKGFISMGLVGFLKSLFLNPFQWVNVRFGGSMTTGRTTSGRDRAVNISWIAIVIGVCSAFVFFYKWVEAVVQRSLQRIGNNIVDTQLPGDDDDLKPPPGWKYKSTTGSSDTTDKQQPVEVPENPSFDECKDNLAEEKIEPLEDDTDVTILPNVQTLDQQQQRSTERFQETRHDTPSASSTPLMSGSWVAVDDTADDMDNSLSGVHRQGWSFSNL